ncbi:M14 family zinc carboxypeptidase [Propionivibrio sp.]|uniref:M14 family zinc carboxypeptidase n=1 Tax=Propionivibrio sp. TaxID=2212460 RepID=UPI003BEF8883
MKASELPELIELERIIAEGATHLDARVMCQVAAAEQNFPVYAITLGNPSPAVPAVGFFGGVHGLERIGSEIVIAFLSSLVKRLQWDSILHRQLESVRLVFMPVVNPGGVWQGTRANPNGVDLMRNAPLDASEHVPFLIGGQRISAGLPWYRGPLLGPMEAESQALCQVVEEELLAREFSIALDCHSGFGISDRIWFPYAHTVTPIAHLPEIHALKEIFDQTNSNHRYIFEPQSRQYLAHGDLWDYLYRRAGEHPARSFLPLTLEMGSWLWVKKNPRQIFSRHGIFNPLIEHRQQRVLRRHMAWFDFLTRAASSHQRWMPTEQARESHQERALAHWYQKGKP